MLQTVVDAVVSAPPLVYVLTGLVTLLYLRTRSSAPKNIPPIPVRPYPIVGHMPMLRGNVSKTLEKWSSSTPGILSVYLGNQLFVILNSYDVMKEALVKKGEFFVNRPKSPFDEVGGGLGVIANSGPPWKEQRTAALAILRSLGMGKNLLAVKIGDEVDVHLDELSKFKGQPCDASLLTNTSLANIICSVLIGKRFELDDPYLIKMVKLLDFRAEATEMFSPVRVFPFLALLPGDPYSVNSLVSALTDVEKHFSERFVSETDTEGEQHDPDSFIAIYLQEMARKRKSGQSTTLDHKNLIQLTCDLFAAGTETTSNTLRWCVLYCLHYPQCQRKMHEEIDDLLGQDRPPRLQDKAGLNYLNAFILEVQRRVVTTPFGLDRGCKADVEVGGYTIPKDAVVVPNVYRVLHDPVTWGDPLTFRPNRFLDKDQKLFVPEQFVPFSMGPRMCLGESLAKAELFLFLAGILQRFDLQPENPRDLPTLEPIYGVTQTPAKYNVKFVSRRER